MSLGSIVKQQVNESLTNAMKNRNGNLINELHKDISVRLNSVNVIVGKQSSGKTVVALEEIIKISRLDKDSERFHLIIYVTKNGDENDVSFQALKELITIPHVTVSEADVTDYMKELVSAKNLYYKIRRESLEDKIDDDQKEDLFEFLHVNDFEKEFLHTIVLFDDISNSKLFRDSGSYFSQMIRRCRHTNISYFLLIQGFKGLPTHVKNEITTLFIFPCFNSQQISYIYTQSGSNLSRDEFKNMYAQLCSYKQSHPDSHPYIVIQVTSGGQTIISR